MEPKFQSSFIPKGPVAPSSTIPMARRRVGGGGFLGFIALLVFIASVVLAGGVVGYKFYLKYSIDNMGADLEEARSALQPDTIRELTRLDNRIASTKELVAGHSVLTPLFEFLEESTPKTIRFSDLRYEVSGTGIVLSLIGEARGYAALAFLADTFNKSPYFENPTFSNINLNEKGDVNFTFESTVDPDLVSYEGLVERFGITTQTPASSTQATTTSN